MTTYVALLRAVNLGGNSTLEMHDLRELCTALGFAGARTYIASGNVIFDDARSESDVRAVLNAALLDSTGRDIGVLVRTANEMTDVVERNPFAEHPGNRVVAVFTDEILTSASLDDIRHQTNEQIEIGEREIFAFYPDGQGRSKLRIPAMATGTGRNINTVTKLAEMATTT